MIKMGKSPVFWKGEKDEFWKEHINESDINL